MGVKSVETLDSKIRFSRVLDIFSSLVPVIMLIFQFPRLHKPQHLRNIELRGRGIRDLTLDANKLEQILKGKFIYLPFIALLSLWYCVGGSITR